MKPTREQILTGPAGQDIDRLVALHVMGVDASQLVSMPIPCPDGKPGCCVAHTALHFPNGMRLPAYSSDISAAWVVVEEMRRRGYLPALFEMAPGEWRVRLLFAGEEGPHIHGVAADSPALAVCRAALLACLKEDA